MTVTAQKPDGALLDARNEPLAFIATNEPAVVAVGFEGIVGKEAAYFDGVFHAPYLASSRVGSLFTLRRDGRWPGPPTLYVDEKQTGAKPWGALYHVDFRTLPAQAMSAPGSYTIDGLTWWLKPGGASSGQMTFTVGARGLHVGSTPGNDASQAYFLRRLILPLANIPGFNPRLPVCFYVRTDRDAPGAAAMCGVIDCAQNAASLSVAEWLRLRSVGHGDNGDPQTSPASARSFLAMYNSGGANYEGASVRAESMPSVTADVQTGTAIFVVNRMSVAYAAFDWRGAAPDPYAGALVFPENGSMWGNAQVLRTDFDYHPLYLDMDNLSFFVTAINGTGPDRPAWLCELSVLQPGVGP